MIDYRELLKYYMNIVGEAEGVCFIPFNSQDPRALELVKIYEEMQDYSNEE